MHIVLVEPEIPPNTGNIARLCAATRTVLHLVDPLGFELSDRRLRRAGMDYWAEVEWHRWRDWASLVAWGGTARRWWFIESGGPTLYSEATYRSEDLLVFGRETAGLPPALLEAHRDTWLRIPINNPRARSLNLANCAALVLFEALRQQGFPGEARPSQLRAPPGAKGS